MQVKEGLIVERNVDITEAWTNLWNNENNGDAIRSCGSWIRLKESWKES